MQNSNKFFVPGHNGYAIVSFIILLIGIGFLIRAIKKARKQPLGFRDAPSLAIVLGLCWGISLRTAATFPPLASVFTIMTIGFLFLSPFSLGYITICAIPPEQPLSKKNIFFYPWGTAASSMIVAMILGFEGAICLIMMCPLWLLIASLGGFVGAWVRKRRATELRSLTLLLMLSPIGMSALESTLPSPTKIYRTENQLEMNCSAEEVWHEIRSVRAIEPHELHFSLSRFMGFPDPIEAKLVGEGIGAIREATFAGGVTFTETVTEWKPNQALAFGIRANTEQIPRTTLDEHVTIGGEYFDMLNGRYEITPRGEKSVLVTLRSEHRLSTKFNFYASLWSKAIMSSIQKNILQVVQARCEKGNKQ